MALVVLVFALVLALPLGRFAMEFGCLLMGGSLLEMEALGPRRVRIAGLLLGFSHPLEGMGLALVSPLSPFPRAGSQLGLVHGTSIALSPRTEPRAERFLMAKHPATARLLAVDPDFGRFLTDEERAGARQLAVPTEVIPKGPVDTGALLADENGFGALVLEGMLMHRLRISDQLAMRLIGPGDFLFLSGAPRSILVEDATCSATAPTRVAILGDETLAAVRRWPGLSSGLFVRLAEQSDRLAVQLAICQLPRVDQRVLSLLWLLAEMWGHVGPAGTALPVAFTHDALGALVGARRPTVTLALGELSDRGAIVRQDGGWLLLEPPPAIAGEPRLTNDEPSLLPRRGAEWRHGSDNQSADLSHEELLRTVETLHQEHTRTRDQIAAQLASVRRSRQRCEEIRTRVAADRATRRVPSSGSARNGRSR